MCEESASPSSTSQEAWAGSSEEPPPQIARERPHRGGHEPNQESTAERLLRQISKTAICRYVPHCRHGNGCRFAHSFGELRNRPNLKKTSLCTKWKAGACALQSNECPFAHGRSDMRATEAFKPKPTKDHKCPSKQAPYGMSPSAGPEPCLTPSMVLVASVMPSNLGVDPSAALSTNLAPHVVHGRSEAPVPHTISLPSTLPPLPHRLLCGEALAENVQGAFQAPFSGLSGCVAQFDPVPEFDEVTDASPLIATFVESFGVAKGSECDFGATVDPQANITCAGEESEAIAQRMKTSEENFVNSTPFNVGAGIGRFAVPGMSQAGSPRRRRDHVAPEGSLDGHIDDMEQAVARLQGDLQVVLEGLADLRTQTSVADSLAGDQACDAIRQEVADVLRAQTAALDDMARSAQSFPRRWAQLELSTNQRKALVLGIKERRMRALQSSATQA